MALERWWQCRSAVICLSVWSGRDMTQPGRCPRGKKTRVHARARAERNRYAPSLVGIPPRFSGRLQLNVPSVRISDRGLGSGTEAPKAPSNAALSDLQLTRVKRQTFCNGSKLPSRADGKRRTANFGEQLADDWHEGRPAGHENRVDLMGSYIAVRQ